MAPHAQQRKILKIREYTISGLYIVHFDHRSVDLTVHIESALNPAWIESGFAISNVLWEK